MSTKNASPGEFAWFYEFWKPVVEKHQGRVWFEANTPPPGTTFFVESPAN